MTSQEICTHQVKLDDLSNLLHKVNMSRIILKSEVDNLELAKKNNHLIKYYFTKVELARFSYAKTITDYQSALGLFIEQVEASEYLKLDLLNQYQLS
jgi:hypothetical protein